MSAVTCLATPEEWATGTLDLAGYLERVGYEGPVEPTAPTLRALHRAHVAAVPFENVDVVLGRRVAVDLDSLQDKLVRQRRGGYCYEHGTLFAAVLEGIGFTVDRLLARIGADRVRPRPRTHMALHVRAGEDEWLADVGFGNALLEPLPWGEEGWRRHGSWTYRMTLGPEDTWIVEQRTGNAVTPLYSLVDQPVHASDVVMANHFTATHPSSPFVGQLVAIRKDDDAFLRLRGRTRTVERSDGSSEVRDLDAGAVLATLQDDIGVPLSEEDAAALEATLVD
ncbi:arylamine N-acetyltransferase [Geodermatophilus sp. TF02-6]|uniref:arylamine N-acetyltransferase family protein n=1 Tax=Geodermatophilus sp. TF02-6 TaxID=2250575 RepID=UPI000DE964E8|nr:arylamine N-acetyltransferase [Geodermatophilus sp. TF02-6]RBY78766.1 arylamine N-acetyltransferase [Geodermatophilus sp. TF02-6]